METIENTDIINTDNLSFKYGVIGGTTIAIMLFLFQLAGNDFSPFLKLSSLIFFAGILIYVLNYLYSNRNEDLFSRGIGLGLKTSLIAALTVIVLNLVLYLVDNSISFSKYSVTPDIFANFLLISGILLFEIFVFGSLISFITLQYLKGKN